MPAFSPYHLGTEKTVPGAVKLQPHLRHGMKFHKLYARDVSITFSQIRISQRFIFMVVGISLLTVTCKSATSEGPLNKFDNWLPAWSQMERHSDWDSVNRSICPLAYQIKGEKLPTSGATGFGKGKRDRYFRSQTFKQDDQEQFVIGWSKQEDFQTCQGFMHVDAIKRTSKNPITYSLSGPVYKVTGEPKGGNDDNKKLIIEFADSASNDVAMWMKFSFKKEVLDEHGNNIIFKKQQDDNAHSTKNTPKESKIGTASVLDKPGASDITAKGVKPIPTKWAKYAEKSMGEIKKMDPTLEFIDLLEITAYFDNRRVEEEVQAEMERQSPRAPSPMVDPSTPDKHANSAVHDLELDETPKPDPTTPGSQPVPTTTRERRRLGTRCHPITKLLSVIHDDRENDA